VSTGVAVTYSATTSGGLAPITVTGSPASGSTFPVGTTSVSVTARSSDGQTASCGFSVTAVYTATSLYGPQSTIQCPAGAIDIFPGTSIQTMVNTYGGGTTFCLRAGVHSITSAITPKTGNTFVGEYGAVLDGTGWTTTDPNQGAFRAHNQDIDNVTIRNLLIRKMPQRGIHAYYQFSDGWTVEYNEITATQIGVAIPNNSIVRNNYIHHNTSGGYNGWKIANTTFDTNQISYNGTAQKVFNTNYVTFRNNFIHHNTDGIHFDSDNSNALIEGNRVEDNGRNGIFYEASQLGVIRNNTVSRNGDTGIFISMSKNVQTYGNTVQDNFRAIQYFLNCDVIGGGAISFDLANNSTHDNNVRVDTTSGAFSNALTLLSSCSSTAAAPYLNGSKNLTFQNNQYTVPYTGRWWVWGFNGFKYWNEWQALPQDSTGTVR
jgi:parallel beta-helix repeat protein